MGKILPEVTTPTLQLPEGLLGSGVVAQQHALRMLVEIGPDIFEALVPGQIEEVHLHPMVRDVWEHQCSFGWRRMVVERSLFMNDNSSTQDHLVYIAPSEDHETLTALTKTRNKRQDRYNPVNVNEPNNVLVL